MSALLKHVGVDHGGGNVLVSQQSLDGPDIRVSLQQMSGKTVAKAMRGVSLL